MIPSTLTGGKSAQTGLSFDRLLGILGGSGVQIRGAWRYSGMVLTGGGHGDENQLAGGMDGVVCAGGDGLVLVDGRGHPGRIINHEDWGVTWDRCKGLANTRQVYLQMGV